MTLRPLVWLAVVGALAGCRTYEDLEAILAEAPVLVVSGLGETSANVAPDRCEPPPHRPSTEVHAFGLEGAVRRRHTQTQVDVIAFALGDQPLHFEDLVATARADGASVEVTVEIPLGSEARWPRHVPPLASAEAQSAMDAHFEVVRREGPSMLRLSSHVHARAVSVRAPWAARLSARIELDHPDAVSRLERERSRSRGVETLALGRELFAPDAPRRLVWKVQCTRRAR